MIYNKDYKEEGINQWIRVWKIHLLNLKIEVLFLNNKIQIEKYKNSKKT